MFLHYHVLVSGCFLPAILLHNWVTSVAVECHPLALIHLLRCVTLNSPRLSNNTTTK